MQSSAIIGQQLRAQAWAAAVKDDMIRDFVPEMVASALIRMRAIATFGSLPSERAQRSLPPLSALHGTYHGPVGAFGASVRKKSWRESKENLRAHSEYRNHTGSSAVKSRVPERASCEGRVAASNASGAVLSEDVARGEVELCSGGGSKGCSASHACGGMGAAPGEDGEGLLEAGAGDPGAGWAAQGFEACYVPRVTPPRLTTVRSLQLALIARCRLLFAAPLGLCTLRAALAALERYRPSAFGAVRTSAKCSCILRQTSSLRESSR